MNSGAKSALYIKKESFRMEVWAASPAHNNLDRLGTAQNLFPKVRKEKIIEHKDAKNIRDSLANSQIVPHCRHYVHSTNVHAQINRAFSALTSSLFKCCTWHGEIEKKERRIQILKLGRWRTDEWRMVCSCVMYIPLRVF